jgi:glutathione S-transferase
MGNMKPISFSEYFLQASILLNMAPITLYFLQTSRAIRTAFLLEALELDYSVEYFNREADGSTPDGFRKTVAVGRAPAIKDGDLVLVESSAIAE